MLIRRAFLLCAAAVVIAPAACAQDYGVSLDPARTTVAITVGATAHTVHGTFKLKSGEVHFDPSSGKASGTIIVDATSGNTENDGRDKKMHREVLESAKFSEITFTPSHVSGAFSPGNASQMQVAGVIRLHGEDHEITLPLAVEPASSGELTISGRFDIPYQKWGLKNPSNFLLHVSDTASVEIRATAHLAAGSAAGPQK
jgi:polyisoprenoid-binding protein YceI